MDESAEFNNFHLPNLLRYVVAIFSGTGDLGSGVLVNVGGRHLVATAAHCIENRPQVMLCRSPVKLAGAVEMRGVRVLDTVRHPNGDIDIGYLEIENPKVPEIGWRQLNWGPIEGPVHIVGYPASHAKVDQPARVITVGQNAFQTNLIEATPEYLKFHYPEHGSAYDAATRTWVPCPFPETPRGFSGGGGFCVCKQTTPVEFVEYRLIGIQSCWLKSERYVKVVPIKLWCDLVVARGIYRG
jgi:hypothetical protein